MSAIRSTLAVGFLLALGCATPTDTAADAPPCTAPEGCSQSGACASNGDCSPGMVCDPATRHCVVGGGCGSEELQPQHVRPNLLLVVDRSCSMKGDIDGVQKWGAAVNALVDLTSGFAADVRFGLLLFPDKTGDACAEDGPAVPVSDDGAQQIAKLLASASDPSSALFPNGPCVTNIDTALARAKSLPAMAESRPRYVLLLTDGKQYGCSLAGGSAGAITITGELAKMGVPTYVVGFGSDLKADPVELNALADAGGVPSDGPEKFYLAADPGALEKQMQAIASTLVSCTYEIDKKPPSPDALYVFVDDASVPRDAAHEDGWDYDPTTATVTFYGPACDSLQSGAATKIDFVLGCPPEMPK